ncbi:MAG: hypothetical protein JSV68_19135, partial [Anaerolineaceae bacterium]
GFLATNGDSKSLCEAIERLLDLSAAQSEQMRKNILAANQAIGREDRVGQLTVFYQETIDSIHTRA